MSCPLRVLLVEDSAVDAELAAVGLEEDGIVAICSRVDSEAAYLEGLEASPDIILSDWNLPRFSGRRALELLVERDLPIPFVIVSGYIGEEAAVDALRRGADDYVLKDRPARLGAAVRSALDRMRLREERDAADAQLRLSAIVFESSAEGVTITDAHASILTVNKAFTDITGYSADEVVGKNPRILQSGRQSVSFYRDMWATLSATGRWSGELWNRRKDGSVYPEWMTISNVAGPDGSTTHFVGVFTDVGNVKKAQGELDFLVHHDALTHLPNRTLLLDRLGQSVRRASAASETVGVVCLDLDGFGAVNDAHGHVVGDAVLKAIGSRLGAQLGSTASLARLGADEFIVVLEGAGNAAHVAARARDLQESVAMPLSIDGHEIQLTATAGLSMFPADAGDPFVLLRQAEAALHQAKSTGRGSIGLFDAALQGDIAKRLDLQRDLRRAAALGELRVHYQPQMRLADGGLVGAEALVRWEHPVLGLLAPGLFIPLAEETGTVGLIGAWVLAEACGQIAAWDAAGLHVPRIAVNLSTQQLEQGDFVELVSAALTRAGVRPERLELEVTESMVMHSVARSTEVLHQLRNIGITVSIDDFGTGHSSLAQLKCLPLRQVKIDMSFVRDIGVDPTGEAIIRATIGLAKGLGLETVAEGVEQEQQVEFLRAAGCDVAQGYLFGRPVPAQEFADRFADVPQ